MRYKKVSLISPPLDEGKNLCVDTGYWIPLNLLTLSSYMKHNGFEGEVQILDHQVLSKEEIISELKNFNPDLVGISPNMDTYQETLKLAKLAKQMGGDVVLGGNYATELGKNILRNQESVDYVISRDGEVALFELIKGGDPEDINNLIYRCEGDRIIQNEIIYNTRASYSDIDYSMIELDPYFSQYANSLYPSGYKKPLTFMTQRGCVWREKSGGCVFCSRIEPFARFDNVNHVWNKIEKLRNKHEMDAILDVSDDFLGNMDWFNSFYESRPEDHRDLGLRFIYSRVNHITPRTAEMLSDLNTKEICLGIESGDRNILKNTVKGSSPEQQLKAVKLLEDHGINLIIAFMIGLPGETEESIKNTYEQACRMLECSNINEMLLSILIPLPGSPAYSMMITKDKKLEEKYNNRDYIDIREMQQDWAYHFCDVDFDKIEKHAEKINNLSSKTFYEMTE